MMKSIIAVLIAVLLMPTKLEAQLNFGTRGPANLDTSKLAHIYILRDDKTFGFSLVEFDESLATFAEITKKEIARIQVTPGLITRDFEINLIHFSAVPWIDFTSYSHARSFTWPDSCPKISYGKMTDENGKKTMAIAVHVHHGLADGYHVGQFLTLLQELMNE